MLISGTEADEEMTGLAIRAFLKKPLRQSQLYNVFASLVNRPAPDNPEESRPGGAAAPEGCFSATRILLVEDNPVNQAVSKAMLDYFGCRTDVVENGRQALTALDVARYDLILMDCQMPEMDGYAATRAIRDREASRGGAPGDSRTPIVALTAHAMDGDRRQCIAAGMDDYLSKPFKPEDLHAILFRWLPPRGAASVRWARGPLCGSFCSLTRAVPHGKSARGFSRAGAGRHSRRGAVAGN